MRALARAVVTKVLPRRFVDLAASLPLVIRARNRLRNRVYYCKALQGESNYNICINSDMTVSCNCRDYDGKGHIGDLSTQSLQEIFDGEVAQRFRRVLAKGRFPVPLCPRCGELVSVDRKDVDRYLAEYHVPRKGIMVENTCLCNLRCLSCDRDAVMKMRKRPRMSLNDLEKVAGIIRDYGIQEVAYHNLGEPFLSDSIYEELSLIRVHNPEVRIVTSTNGMFLDGDTKGEAALLVDNITFSIDGSSQDLVARYQVGADFDKSCANMRNLVALRDSRGLSRPEIEWKYVVFDWNDKEPDIERAIELAKEAGVDIISFWLGGGPRAHVSRRFLYHSYFQGLGKKSWKGREIDFREG